MEELKHRIDLFQTKIGVAIAQMHNGKETDALNTLKGALEWDKDIYQKEAPKFVLPEDVDEDEYDEAQKL